MKSLTFSNLLLATSHGTFQPGPILTSQPLTAAVCNFLNCRLYIFIRGALVPHNPPANPS